MTLREEMIQLVRALDAAGIPYALCGGLAMAAHGWPRATMDIDLLIEETRLEAVKAVARVIGYEHEAGLMVFAGGRVRLFRVVKVQGTEFMPLDLLLATGDLAEIWQHRVTLATDDGDVTVLSTESLARMKALRGSGIDQDDIRKLEGKDDDDA